MWGAGRGDGCERIPRLGASADTIYAGSSDRGNYLSDGSGLFAGVPQSLTLLFGPNAPLLCRRLGMPEEDGRYLWGE